MVKKSDSVYFDFFREIADCALNSCKILAEFDKENIKEIYQIKESVEKKKQQYLTVLEKAFMTPIDRELLLEAGRKLISFENSVKDISAAVYFSNIDKMREEMPAFISVLEKICRMSIKLAEEIENYKNPTKLKEISGAIKEIEREGERLYIQSMKRLFFTEKDALEIAVWQKIYVLFLKAFTAGGELCEIAENISVGKG